MTFEDEDDDGHVSASSTKEAASAFNAGFGCQRAYGLATEEKYRHGRASYQLFPFCSPRDVGRWAASFYRAIGLIPPSSPT